MASLEEALAENTLAIKGLMAALKLGASGITGGGAAAGTAAAAGKTGTAAGKAGNKTPPKPKHTFEQVTTSVMEVKNTIDKDTARECIEGVAGVGKKLADIANTPEHFDAIVAACKEAMEASGSAVDDDDV